MVAGSTVSVPMLPWFSVTFCLFDTWLLVISADKNICTVVCRGKLRTGRVTWTSSNSREDEDSVWSWVLPCVGSSSVLSDFSPNSGKASVSLSRPWIGILVLLSLRARCHLFQNSWLCPEQGISRTGDMHTAVCRSLVVPCSRTKLHWPLCLCGDVVNSCFEWKFSWSQE